VEDELQPHLAQAQQALDSALEEACGVDLKRVDTDEMIRIEEVLTVASEAAKQVVSVRLRRRDQRAQDSEASSVAAAAPADMPPTMVQRVFDDIRGKRWRVFAVYPSMSTLDRSALPAPYRDGWLSFESDDEKRRIAPIPARWHELDIEDLRLLCFKAERAPRRSGPSLPPPPA